MQKYRVYEHTYVEEEERTKRMAYGIMLAALLVSIPALLPGIQIARAITTIYIQSDGTVYPIGAPIEKNGDVYTLTDNINSDVDGIVIERNNTILDGAGHTIQGTKAPSSRGIYLSGNYNVTVKNIDIKTFECGILLDAYSTYNRISGNKLEGNDYGINCWAYADNNNIIGNNITANNLAGIWLVGSSNNNVAENSIVGSNQYGISLQSSSSDTICHNNFIDNTNQVSIYDSTCSWDNGYPSGGNYWSDYLGADSNGDGIGDIPYSIDESNQDRYPLMEPWTNIAISKIALSKTIIGQGYALRIYVSVQNQGWTTETFNITAYANTTIIQIKNVTLPSRSPKNITLTWDTAGLVKGNYSIWAYAWPVQGETDTADNTPLGDTVYVGIPRDINADGIVEMMDFYIASQNFMKTDP